MLALAAQPAPAGDIAIPERSAQTLEIDILLKQPTPKCDPKTNEEIIVCADRTDDESQRLRPIANDLIYGKDESAAEFGISENVRMAVAAESEELQQGIIAKRLMVNLKIKF